MEPATQEPGAAAPAETPFVDEAALGQLEQEAASAAPPPGAEAARPPLTKTDFADEARVFSQMLLGGISMGIEATQGIKVTFPGDAVDKGAERLLPLAVKYQGQIPPWIIAYKEELLAGMWMAGVMFETYKQVKAHQVQQAKAASA